jgi:hypothetical protein
MSPPPVERMGLRCLEALMMAAVVGAGFLIAPLAARVDASVETSGVPPEAVLVVGVAAAVPVVGIIAVERELAGTASPRWRGLGVLAGLLTLLLILPTLGWGLFWGGAGA